MAKVTMPQLGESVAEGTIGKWLKQPGDHVAKYEPLLEVITDKVNAEVPSPFEGTLKEILAEEGATVPNNAEIAVIETADEGAPSTSAPEPSTSAPEPATAGAGGSPAPAGPAPAAEPVAAEQEAAPSELDTGGAQVERRGEEPEPAHGPAGSDERPDRGASAPAAPVTAAPAAAPVAAATPTSTPAASPAAERAAASATPSAPAISAAAGAEHGTNGEARMTPAVRRLLREHGLQPSQIRGTGGGGRITREDVVNYVEAQRTGQAVGGQAVGGQAVGGQAVAGQAVGRQAGQPVGGQAVATAQQPVTQRLPGPAQAAASAPAPAPASAAPSAAPPASAPAPAPASVPSPTTFGGQKVTFPEGADEVLVPMTQMRKGIAAQMTRALQVPHAYVQMEVDATRLVRAREQARAEYQAREGTSLSYVPFVVKAAVAALTKHPAFNAHWTEQGLLAKRRINVGVAVAVEDGLIVPVVRDVDQLSIAGINRAIADVAARARANRLRVDDFGGGTFTIDNTGWFGSNLTMPIINVPEVAILTMEAVTKRPVVVEQPEGDVIAIRPVMNMVLAIDHRANDGAQAAAFLRDVKAWLEAVGPETPIY